MTLASAFTILRGSPRLPLALALALALPLVGGCEVKTTDFKESDTAATESGTSSSGQTTDADTDTDTDTGTGTTDGPMTTGTDTDGPTTTDGPMTTGANPTTGGVACESLGSEECNDDPECIWAEITPWQEADECPILGGEGSCIAGQYFGDGCIVFEECNPERVYHREVAPGEHELFEGKGCGTEPIGDWELCNPGELSVACECFCSP